MPIYTNLSLSKFLLDTSATPYKKADPTHKKVRESKRIKEELKYPTNKSMQKSVNPKTCFLFVQSRVTIPGAIQPRSQEPRALWRRAHGREESRTPDVFLYGFRIKSGMTVLFSSYRSLSKRSTTKQKS